MAGSSFSASSRYGRVSFVGKPTMSSVQALATRALTFFGSVSSALLYHSMASSCFPRRASRRPLSYMRTERAESAATAAFRQDTDSEERPILPSTRHLTYSASASWGLSASIRSSARSASPCSPRPLWQDAAAVRALAATSPPGPIRPRHSSASEYLPSFSSARPRPSSTSASSGSGSNAASKWASASPNLPSRYRAMPSRRCAAAWPGSVRKARL